MNIRRTLKTTTAFAALAAALTLASCAAESTGALDDADFPIVGQPAAEATPKTDVAPTAKAKAPAVEKDTDPTAGLNVGDTVPTEQCETINADPTTFGHGYEMLDGTCRFVRYGDPVPEEVRLDVQARVQKFPANTVHLTEGERLSESLGGLEIGFMRCYSGMWNTERPTANGGGTYEQEFDQLKGWMDAGTSRTYVVINQC